MCAGAGPMPFIVVGVVTIQESNHRILNILVVDDNATNRMIVRRFLERKGHKVSVARSGYEAVAMASTPWDLVLMDINMPGMDGFEATIAMTQRSSTALIVFALTAQDSDQTIDKAIESGMKGVIPKPLNCTSFSSIVSQLPESHTP